jgi:2-methylcitrate dehydratase PrpD
MAAELAARGLTGPTAIYEAEDGGFLRALVDAPDAAQLTRGLGTRWHAADSLFKPYACCGSLHSHVDAALELRPRWRRGGRVRVGLAKVVAVQCGYDYAPGSELNAQMSARYCIAAALSDGAVLPDQFTAGRIADPAVTRLAQAIELVHDPALDALYPAHFAGWVEVETEEGRMARVERLDPSGSPANPGMAESLRRKFFALAVPALGERGAASLAAAFDGLDEVSARDLVRCSAVA